MVNSDVASLEIKGIDALKSSDALPERPLLALRPNTEAILGKTLYWAPPVSDWLPLKKTKNSSLRFACIAEDRLALGLDFEGEMLTLTPSNWKSTLRYAKPDFLLVESIWISSTGHWHIGQHPASPEYSELVALVKLARELSIPTIFWFTRGQEYHEHYRDFARHFDRVFCADPMEIDKLASEGIKADLLLPCVQPALFNPFRCYEQREDFGLNILFDGWADIDRMADKLAVLQKLKPFGLNIIESRYQMFSNRLEASPEYRDFIFGCVTQPGLLTALKYAKAYATHESSLSSKTTQQWMSLEAAASRLPVVHFGKLDADDMRRDFVVECTEELDYIIEFVRYREDGLYRERVGHLGWRGVNLQHTFAHRIQSICKSIGIANDWDEYPKASLITPTYRRDLLSGCLDTYNQITYPNKELILVFNGDALPTYQDLGLKAPKHDVIITHVPRDMFAGATLNMGHLHATGKYCFRIDDDDHYGPYYVLDMILQARGVDACLFGKPPVPLIFDGEKEIYAKRNSISLVVVPQEKLRVAEIWMGGNSIAGTREFFMENSYGDNCYGAADSMFVMGLEERPGDVFAFMDQFNLVAERRKSLASHTWKIDQAKLKADRRTLMGIDEVMI